MSSHSLDALNYPSNGVYDVVAVSSQSRSRVCRGHESLVDPSHPRFSAGVGIPLSGANPEGTARMEKWDAGDVCSYTNEPTPEANRYGVGSAARLKLREQVPDV